MANASGRVKQKFMNGRSGTTVPTFDHNDPCVIFCFDPPKNEIGAPRPANKGKYCFAAAL
jgi:hypothetical protein